MMIEGSTEGDSHMVIKQRLMFGIEGKSGEEYTV